MNDQLMKQMFIMNEIMRITLLVNNLSEYDVFINYYGHVNEMEFTVYENGWHNNEVPTKRFNVKFDSTDGGFSMLSTIINYLQYLYMKIDITDLMKEGAESFV
ncbi:hypothetical protein AN1V17_12210 [Vallitalea sediminicola]